jgi:hypothetical protein
MAISISQISPSSPYNSKDSILLNPITAEATFNPELDYIEYVITTPNESFKTVDYNYSTYSFPVNGTVTSNAISDIEIDPLNDINRKGYGDGEFKSYYNFYRNQLGTSVNNPNLFIKEISADRTELKLRASSPISQTDITLFKDSITSPSQYYTDFYLNFGNNNLVVANNFDYNSSTSDIIINLYQPLPSNIQTSDTLWIVTQIADQLAFSISFTPEFFDPPVVTFNIQGPNFNLPIQDKVNNSTNYIDYSTLLSNTLTSSVNQIESFLAEKSIEISIDYTDFSNFIHFSSAYQRLSNFYYKVKQIEDYTNDLNALASVTSSLSSSVTIQNNIKSIIKNFDGYEYYMYYESGSYTWPKSNSTVPYTLYSTGSTQVLNWFGSNTYGSSYYGGRLLSASLYDENNQDYLFNAIPEYLRDDERNSQYYLFVELVGQHYDSIWTYYKDVTNRYNADNRLDFGISKDLVAEALKSFGVKIYQNNFTSDDLFNAFTGFNTGSTGINLTPTGSDLITEYVTASYEASITPIDDYNKEIYKRIYHNLPYLAKTKGTIPGLRALINCFGVPDTILRISEFGGRDKDTSTYDYFDQQFDYALDIQDGSRTYVTSSFRLLNPWPIEPSNNGGPPDSIQLRIKPNNDFQSSIFYSQSIFEISGSDGGYTTNLSLTYTGSGLNTSSYSGSAINPYYQFATLTLDIKGNLSSAYTCSIYAPFFDGNWWSIMINRSGSLDIDGNTDDSTFTLYAGNNLYYDGYDGNQIGYLESSSYTGRTWGWSGADIYYFTDPISPNYSDYTPFVGQAQEIRYWAGTQSIEPFKDYIMNPQSINHSGETTYADRLAFRAPLGGDLYTGSISVHPKITGSWVITQSFKDPIQSSAFAIINGRNSFIPNIEPRFLNSPVIGLKGRVTDKIQIISSSLPTGSVLSQYTSIEQSYPSLGSESPDVNMLEVAFSPQNEVNDDIVDSLGYFNIGEYIGDPRQVSSSATSYPDLNTLSNNFFQKYFDTYDLTDYIRLIKYFDNSLFKMIKDFVPARTSLTSGVVIKQHILERNKYPQPQVEWEELDYSGSIDTAFISGSTGGTFNQYNTTTFAQDWVETVYTPVGVQYISQSSQYEFYNGELPGTEFVVTDGELNPDNDFKYPTTLEIYYNPTLYLSSNVPLDYFLNPVTSPNQGEIYLWYDTGSTINPSITPGAPTGGR